MSYHDYEDVFVGYQVKDADGRVKKWNKLIPISVWKLFEDKMTEKEQLFANFFNAASEKIAVTDMSIGDISIWIEDLEKIVLEAKATIQAAEDNRRKKIANLSDAEREKLLSKTPPLVSDALSAVKKRKDRMSKADKLYESLIATGMSEVDARQIAGNIKVDETKQEMANKIVNELNNKPSTDTSSSSKSIAEKIADKIINDSIKATEDKNNEPFDPSKMFG